MAPKQHPGWRPELLKKEWRQAYGLSLDSAGERLRHLAADDGLPVPAANFQTLWQHEQGRLYPECYWKLSLKKNRPTVARNEVRWVRYGRR